jgi:putative ABC transport system substrate-binding protein
LEHSQHGGDRLGIELHATFVNGSAELTPAFEQAASEKMDAVIIQPSLPIERAAELALVNHLPAASPTSGFAHAGGLMSYSADYAELWHETAVYVAKILRGAKPADLPVEQTMKLDLVFNLKTAKALDVTIPPSMLALADQVIELR